jgi:hypothetical protein
MELLFYFFLVPRPIIAGIVGIATWYMRAVTMTFRVAFDTPKEPVQRVRTVRTSQVIVDN